MSLEGDTVISSDNFAFSTKTIVLRLISTDVFLATHVNARKF